MDPLERAEILFCQLDLLLAGGHLEAARDLGSRLRDHLTDAGLLTHPASSVGHDERAAVLEPLATMLRKQRALARDIKAAVAEVQASEASRADPVDPARLGELLSRGAEDIQAALEAIAEHLDAMAAERLITEAGRGVARLRKAVRSGRMSPVRDALDSLRELVHEVGPEALADSHLGQLMHDFVTRLDPSGIRAITEGLADRQGILLAASNPVPPEARATPDSGHALRRALAEAHGAMTATREALTRRDLTAAEEPARQAARALGSALKAVDDALGSRDFASLSSTGFLTPFVAGQQPEWELPAALGLRFHEALHRAALPGPVGRELTQLVRRLMESGQSNADVRFHQHAIDVAGGREAIDVRTHGAWRSDGARYLVRLTWLRGADGGLRPAPLSGERAFPTIGGTATVLLATQLEDCSLCVMRLVDGGDGPRVGYVDEDEGLSMRSLVDLRMDQQFDVVEQIPSPVRGEVLAWLDSLENEAEGPIPEEILRQLGIPWYDPSDLVDVIRPVHERLTYELLANKAEDDDFPGLAWLNEQKQAFFEVNHGPDGKTPRVFAPRSLIRYLAWSAKKSDKKPSEPSFTHILTAIQLHLGLKLTFYDDPDASRIRGDVHRAARALERSYLQSRGLDPSGVRDLFTRLAMRYAADREAEAGEQPWERWSRHTENLFEARAGEELLRGGRLPASAVFGSLRGTLAVALREQGQLAAARAAAGFDGLADAAVVFANLLIEPTTQEGVLIVGDSKLGKSSITARLVSGSTQRGVEPWRFGASDRILVLVPRRGEGPRGDDRPMATASPAHRKFGQWTEELWYRDSGKREVKPRDHVVSRAVVPIRTLVFVRRDSGEMRGAGLAPRSIADLIQDFQRRFGFTASQRFWRSLFRRVSVMELALRRRGADTFHEAAEAVRSHMHEAEDQAGLGTPRMAVVRDGEAWYGVSQDRGRIRVTRVGFDGIDLDYFFAADGSVNARPDQLGKEVPLASIRSFRLDGLDTLVPLDSGRIEELFDRAHYRIGSNRLMPLHTEYYRATAMGPCFLIPDLPHDVQTAVGQMMRRDPGRWGSYLETSR